MRYSLHIAALLALASCSSDPISDLPPDPAFSVAPRLDLAGATTALFSWVPTDTTASTQLHLGTDRDALGQAFGPEAEDSLRIATAAQLVPGSTYYYAVSASDATGLTTWSDTVSFQTRAIEMPDLDGATARLQDTVGRLTGHAEIRPGLSLTTRSDSVSRREVADFLADRLAANGLSPQRHVYDLPLTTPHGTYILHGQNIFATIPATTASDDWVIVGGHYDSVSVGPGATDNATGTAVALEAAREISHWRVRTKNVMVVLFDQEELGAIGSREFAQWFDEAGYRLHSMHNVDMVGWDTDGDGAFVLSSIAPPPEVLASYRLAAREVEPDVPLAFVDSYNSDHIRFAHATMLSLGFDDVTPFYHRAGDTYETVDFPHTLKAARLLLTALRLLIGG